MAAPPWEWPYIAKYCLYFKDDKISSNNCLGKVLTAYLLPTDLPYPGQSMATM